MAESSFWQRYKEMSPAYRWEKEQEAKKQEMQLQFLRDLVKEQPQVFNTEEVNRMVGEIINGKGLNLPSKQQTVTQEVPAAGPVLPGGKSPTAIEQTVQKMPIPFNDKVDATTQLPVDKATAQITGLPEGAILPKYAIDASLRFATQKATNQSRETIADKQIKSAEQRTEMAQTGATQRTVIAQQGAGQRTEATQASENDRVKQAAVNAYIKQMNAVISSPNSSDNDKVIAAKGITIANETGEIPDYNAVNQNPIVSFFKGPKFDVKPKSGGEKTAEKTSPKAQTTSPAGNKKLQDAARAYLQKYGQPTTDANIKAVIDRGLVQ
jgi:hypothetical protein